MEMERTLTNLLDNFGQEQFDFASQNENELFKDEYQGYKVTDKDELDRLNKEKTFRMYSGMQEVDGKLTTLTLIIRSQVSLIISLTHT